MKMTSSPLLQTTAPRPALGLCRQRRRARVASCLLAPLFSCAATVTPEAEGRAPDRSELAGSEAVRADGPVDAETGNLPEAEVLSTCPSVTIESAADLIAARRCREIDGDLVFAGREPMDVSADALPFLERVTGSVLTRVPAPLREITLPALREVGTEGSDDALEFVFDRMTLERVSLPNLRAVHGTLGIGALGALTELRLGSLESVDAVFGLMNLPKLTTLELPSDIAVGQRVAFEYLCHIPYDELPPIATGSNEQSRVRVVGCCTESQFECTFAACECE